MATTHLEIYEKRQFFQCYESINWALIQFSVLQKLINRFQTALGLQLKMKSDLKALFLLLLLVLSIDGKIMSIQQKGSVDIQIKVKIKCCWSISISITISFSKMANLSISDKQRQLIERDAEKSALSMKGDEALELTYSATPLGTKVEKVVLEKGKESLVEIKQEPKAYLRESERKLPSKFEIQFNKQIKEKIEVRPQK